MSEIAKGSCYCQAVQWSFDLPAKVVVMCHCKMCRKLRGSDYSTHVFVPEEQFRITEGEDKLTSFQATDMASFNFCRVCGSPVYGVNNRQFSGHVAIPRGMIDSEVELNPRFQVFTESKATWVTIHDEVRVMRKRG